MTCTITWSSPSNCTKTSDRQCRQSDHNNMGLLIQTVPKQVTDNADNQIKITWSSPLSTQTVPKQVTDNADNQITILPCVKE